MEAAELGAAVSPFRKPVDRELLDWEKESDTGVNRIRYVIERVIANFKTWRIMHTDYPSSPRHVQQNDLSSRCAPVLPGR
jgi:hypothetical protein